MRILSSRSDVELLGGIGRGCEESFRLFFRRWSPRLLRFLTQATGSREAGEDLLQEAFIRIYQAAPRYEPRGSIAAWLYRICANLAYSYWRRQRLARPAIDGDRAMIELRAPASEEPDQARLLRAFEIDLDRALGNCGRNQRAVFLLKTCAGLTYAEIAETLECPVGTVKSRYHHAVRILRRSLERWECVDLAGGRSEK